VIARQLQLIFVNWILETEPGLLGTMGRLYISVIDINEETEDIDRDVDGDGDADGDTADSPLSWHPEFNTQM